MTLRFSPAPLPTHSATPPTHPAKAATAATAAMAAAPHDGFDHAAIPNDDVLSWPRVPHGPEAAVGWRPPRAEGATGAKGRRETKAAIGQVDEGGVGHRDGGKVGKEWPWVPEGQGPPRVPWGQGPW